MSEEVRRRALEPFYTTKGKAGTGLGLPQVSGFLRQIRGDMRIESTAGGGTSEQLLFRKAPTAALERSGQGKLREEQAP